MAWLGTWAKRRKITIDHTKFDADLTWFPLRLFFAGTDYGGSMTEFWTDLGSNKYRIAVTQADQVTQLYVEYESFGWMGPGFASSGHAMVWVSRTGWTISSTVDTDIYLYWDNAQPDNTTYVGDSGVRTEVWDSNFATVHHMNGIADSTSNHLDGTLIGGPSGSGTSYSFNGTSQAYSIPDSTVYNQPRSTLSMEMYVQEKANTQYRILMGKGNWGATSLHFYNDNPYLAGKIRQSGGTFNDVALDSTSQAWMTTPDSTFHHIALTMTPVASGEGYLYIDGVLDSTDQYANGLTDLSDGLPITLASANGSNYNNCEIEEFRLSLNARPAAYCKATFNTLRGLGQSWAATEALGGGGPTLITASDVPTMAYADVSAVAATLSRTDPPTLSLTDVSASVLLSTRPDAPTLSAADVSSVLGVVNTSDPPTLSLADVSASALTSTRTDTPTLSYADVSTVAVTVGTADAPTLSAADVSAILAMVGASDVPTLALADISAVATVLLTTETLLFEIIEGTQQLTPNQQSVETNMAGLASVSNCTVARSTTKALDGVASMAMTCNTVSPTDMQAWTTPNVACYPGQVVTGEAWFSADTVSRQCQIQIRWADGVGALITTTGTPLVSDATTGWVKSAGNGVAPAGTQQVTIKLVVNTPANGETHYVDRMSMTIQTVAVVVPTTDVPTLSAPETSAPAVTVSTADVPTLSLADVSALAGFLTTTDVPTLSLAEGRTLAATVSTTDVPTVSVTETRVIAAVLNTTDVPTLSLAEGRTLIAVVSTADAPTMSLAEARTLVGLLTRNDAPTLSLTETSIVGISVLASNSLQMTLIETSSVFFSTQAFDTLVLAAQDAHVLAQHGIQGRSIQPQTKAMDEIPEDSVMVEVPVGRMG